MREAGPELVTLHLWRVPRRAVPAAVPRMGVDRRAVRRAAGGFAVEAADGTVYGREPLA